jgi:hypothetical protein
MGLVYGESVSPFLAARSIRRLWRSHKFGLLSRIPAFQRGDSYFQGASNLQGRKCKLAEVFWLPVDATNSSVCFPITFRLL